MINKLKSLTALAFVILNVSTAHAAGWQWKATLASVPQYLNVSTCDHRVVLVKQNNVSSTYSYSNDRFDFKNFQLYNNSFGTGYYYSFEVPLDQLSVVANSSTLSANAASNFVNKAYLNAKTYSMSCTISYSNHTRYGRSATLFCGNNAAGSDAAFTDALPLNANLFWVQEKCD